MGCNVSKERPRDHAGSQDEIRGQPCRKGGEEINTHELSLTKSTATNAAPPHLLSAVTSNADKNENNTKNGVAAHTIAKKKRAKKGAGCSANNCRRRKRKEMTVDSAMTVIEKMPSFVQTQAHTEESTSPPDNLHDEAATNQISINTTDATDAFIISPSSKNKNQSSNNNTNTNSTTILHVPEEGDDVSCNSGSKNKNNIIIPSSAMKDVQSSPQEELFPPPVLLAIDERNEVVPKEKEREGEGFVSPQASSMEIGEGQSHDVHSRRTPCLGKPPLARFSPCSQSQMVALTKRESLEDKKKKSNKIEEDETKRSSVSSNQNDEKKSFVTKKNKSSLVSEKRAKEIVEEEEATAQIRRAARAKAKESITCNIQKQKKEMKLAAKIGTHLHNNNNKHTYHLSGSAAEGDHHEEEEKEKEKSSSTSAFFSSSCQCSSSSSLLSDGSSFSCSSSPSSSVSSLASSAEPQSLEDEEKQEDAYQIGLTSCIVESPNSTLCLRTQQRPNYSQMSTTTPRGGGRGEAAWVSSVGGESSTNCWRSCASRWALGGGGGTGEREQRSVLFTSSSGHHFPPSYFSGSSSRVGFVRGSSGRVRAFSPNNNTKHEIKRSSLSSDPSRAAKSAARKGNGSSFSFSKNNNASGSSFHSQQQVLFASGEERCFYSCTTDIVCSPTPLRPLLPQHKHHLELQREHAVRQTTKTKTITPNSKTKSYTFSASPSPCASCSSLSAAENTTQRECMEKMKIDSGGGLCIQSNGLSPSNPAVVSDGGSEQQERSEGGYGPLAKDSDVSIFDEQALALMSGAEVIGYRFRDPKTATAAAEALAVASVKRDDPSSTVLNVKERSRETAKEKEGNSAASARISVEDSVVSDIGASISVAELNAVRRQRKRCHNNDTKAETTTKSFEQKATRGVATDKKKAFAGGKGGDHGNDVHSHYRQQPSLKREANAPHNQTCNHHNRHHQTESSSPFPHTIATYTSSPNNAYENRNKRHESCHPAFLEAVASRVKIPLPPPQQPLSGSAPKLVTKSGYQNFPSSYTTMTAQSVGADPRAFYAKAKLSVRGGSQDMAVFRSGVDACVVNKKPEYHLYDPAIDPMLAKAKAEGIKPYEFGGGGGDNSTVEGGDADFTDTFIPRSTTTATSSFADLMKPTCTWDLLHSIPNAVEKVNSGDLLYRFCARKYKDLTLEDRIEVASLVNLTGFDDELAENDQPILDFVLNENSEGPCEKSVAALAAAEEKREKETAKRKSKKTAGVSPSADIVASKPPSPAEGKAAMTAYLKATSAFPKTNTPAETRRVAVDDYVVCVLRLVGFMPLASSKDGNVDCVMNVEYQRLLATYDEVFETIDRFRTYRKVKNVIPFVFSFRFQMTGSEIADDKTLEEHTHHHDAKPTRIVVMERTRKHRGVDSTIKSKAFNIYYDIPPRGVSSITGKPLAPEDLRAQEDALVAAALKKREEYLLQVAKAATGSNNHHKQQQPHHTNTATTTTTADPREAFADPLVNVDLSTPETRKRFLEAFLPAVPGGVLVQHTAIIIRSSIPTVLSGMVEALGNKLGKQATGQIFLVRQFLHQKKLEKWDVMEGGGDNPHTRLLWEM